MAGRDAGLQADGTGEMISKPNIEYRKSGNMGQGEKRVFHLNP